MQKKKSGSDFKANGVTRLIGNDALSSIQPYTNTTLLYLIIVMVVRRSGNVAPTPLYTRCVVSVCVCV